GLLLPGGAGFFARFDEPNTLTGGGRVEIWAAIGEQLTQASAKELLIGHGFESSQRVVQRRFATLTSAHNAYLQVLFDYGLLGLALFLTLHGHALARSWAIRGRDGALMLGLVTFLLGTNLFMTTPDGFMYWTALGFVLAIGAWHGVGTPMAQHAPRNGVSVPAVPARQHGPGSDEGDHAQPR
ncbi:MAG: O-antigen ligase family protein, partial [Trueperaceae bacterium]